MTMTHANHHPLNKNHCSVFGCFMHSLLAQPFSLTWASYRAWLSECSLKQKEKAVVYPLINQPSDYKQSLTAQNRPDLLYSRNAQCWIAGRRATSILCFSHIDMVTQLQFQLQMKIVPPFSDKNVASTNWICFVTLIIPDSQHKMCL